MKQPPALPPLAPEKKGMPALGWVGIGCGGLAIIAIATATWMFFMVKDKVVGFMENPEKATAEMMVEGNPNLEMVSEDKESGEMRIRTKDGKEVTLSYKEISEGKIVMIDEDGNETLVGSSDFSNIPLWVPRAPDFTGGLNMYYEERGGKVRGQFLGKSGADFDALEAYYKDQAAILGMGSSSSDVMNLGGTAICSLSFSGGGRAFKVVITNRQSAKSQVNINYSGAK